MLARACLAYLGLMVTIFGSFCSVLVLLGESLSVKLPLVRAQWKMGERSCPVRFEVVVRIVARWLVRRVRQVRVVGLCLLRLVALAVRVVAGVSVWLLPVIMLFLHSVSGGLARSMTRTACGVVMVVEVMVVSRMEAVMWRAFTVGLDLGVIVGPRFNYR